VPTRHRDVLSATAAGQLTITKHPHGCLMVFPRPEWEKFRERIAALPMSAQWWKRIFLGNAMDVEMDGTGRVLVSPELRQAAGIAKDTMLLGMGNHFELWDKATYDAKEAKPCKGRCLMSSRTFPSKDRAVNTPWNHTTVLLNEAVDALFNNGADTSDPSGAVERAMARNVC
jgi:MraZ protein